MILCRGQPPISAGKDEVSPALFPRLAIPPDYLLLEEVELIRAEQILLPGNSTILRKGRARLSGIGEVVCSLPNLRLAVPPEILLPQEVELLLAGHTLLLDEC